jgi:nicotinate-nucleotide adenylyltransferase
VALAWNALQTLDLRQVVLLPCAEPPHKPDRSLAARHHRLEMIYLAVEDRPGLGVSTIEIAEPGMHFTIDTLRVLRASTPALSPIFLCGSDALADVGSWREHEALLAEFDFAAVLRPTDAGDSPDVRWPEAVSRRVSPFSATDPAGGHVYQLAMPPLPVSSSLVRTRCAMRQSIEDLVPTRVARYIQRHALYLEEGPR